MIDCPVCTSKVIISRVDCCSCGVGLEGAFSLPRLARLSKEHYVLAEKFLLSGGNLKELSLELDISYPTLRKRVDEMILALRLLQEEDQKRIETVLTDIDEGRISPEQGIRSIKEINGEL